jgi:hypothetical protein
MQHNASVTTHPTGLTQPGSPIPGHHIRSVSHRSAGPPREHCSRLYRRDVVTRLAVGGTFDAMIGIASRQLARDLTSRYYIRCRASRSSDVGAGRDRWSGEADAHFSSDDRGMAGDPLAPGFAGGTPAEGRG